MTVEEAKKAVVDLAESEVGYHEKASNASLDDPDGNSGGNNWTKYARDLDSLPNFYNGAKNGFAWCDIFVDWLFVKTFGEEKGREMLYQPKQSAGVACTQPGITNRRTLFTGQIRESEIRSFFPIQLGSIRTLALSLMSTATPSQRLRATHPIRSADGLMKHQTAVLPGTALPIGSWLSSRGKSRGWSLSMGIS